MTVPKGTRKLQALRRYRRYSEAFIWARITDSTAVRSAKLSWGLVGRALKKGSCEVIIRYIRVEIALQARKNSVERGFDQALRFLDGLSMRHRSAHSPTLAM